MYCPQCGQNQIANDVRYCSRCGFLLVGVTHLLATGGVLPPTNTKVKRQKTKQRGVKQGVLMMMLATIIVSLIAALGGEIEAAIFFSLIGHLGGLMRIIYSLLFLPSATPENLNQSPLEAAYVPPSPASFTGTPQPAAALPPHAPRVSLFDTVRRRRRTGELVAPPSSVTDHTTRLLKKESGARRQEPE